MYQTHAHAKVNIFLKITGHKEWYHTLSSRFVQVPNLYDTITFVPQQCDRFTIEGCGDIPLESNSIYHAYRELNQATGDLDILEFFYNHKVVIDKRIPTQAGLGGGSSDAGAFLRLVKEACDLLISTEALAHIGAKVGADVPFFVYNYPSANVSGFGERVEPFEENPLEIRTYTPPVASDTTQVYKIFKEKFLSSINPASSHGWEQMKSKEIIAKFNDPHQLNDLYQASLIANPSLNAYAKEGWYFSGSGSSFFQLSK
jgi:4-diphosphocytidyl-2-C-methyl-D-erythritol kinase